MNKKMFSGILLASVLLMPSVMFAQVSATTTLGGLPTVISSPVPSTQVSSISIERNGNTRLMGIINSVSGTSLSIASWGGTWTVDASSAKLLRKYGGASSISEFQNGDSVTVSGIASMSSLSIVAKHVQDTSIQSKNVNPSGTISNISGTSFTLTTSSKSYQVSTDSSTKITINGKASSFTNLAPSVVARVQGVLDRNNSSIKATRIEQTSTTNLSGTISNVNGSTFTLVTSKGSVVVTIDPSTIIELNSGRAAAVDLVSGMHARLSGTWTTVNSAVNATKIYVHTTRPMSTKTTINASTSINIGSSENR
jgi:hypothetical protein